MNERLIAAFDECLNALERGASLEECLKHYPDLADELRVLLEIADQTSVTLSSIRAPAGSQEASRKRLFAQAASLPIPKNGRVTAMNQMRDLNPAQPRHAPMSWLQSLTRTATSRAFAVIVAFLILILLTGTGVVKASANSLPGTPLYSLKRTLETTQIDLAPNAESRARLEGEFSERRTQEARQVTQRGWSVALEFGGSLDAMNNTTWSVAGVTVIVPAGTPIEGSPQIGLYIWVQGTTQPTGTILASQISVEGVRLEGRVQGIRAGAWQVNGLQVLVNEDTVIEDEPGIGDLVEVNAMILPGGSMIAERIQLIMRNPTGEDGRLPEATVEATESQFPSSTQATPESDGDDHDGNISQTPEPTNVSSSGEGGSFSLTNTPSEDGHDTPQGPSQTSLPAQTPQPSQTPNPGGSSDGSSTSSTQEVRFQGMLQSIKSNVWIVAGQPVLINGSTEIDDNPQVGDIVEVRANKQPDGSLIATRIKKSS